jgi:hypothetical protein
MGNSCQKERDKENERTVFTEIKFKKDENNVISVADLPFAPIKMADYEEAIIRVSAKSSDLKNMRDNNCINKATIELNCLKEDAREEGFSNYQKVNSCGCNGKCNKTFNQKLKLLLLLFIVIFLICELRM